MPRLPRLTGHLPFSSSLLCTLALTLVAVAVLTPPLVSPAAGQPSEEVPPLVDEITVEVVNVDVVVTDKKGRPVSGLTADDFLLYEDGEERDISNFYAFNDGRVRAAVPADEPAPTADSTASGESRWPDRQLRRRMAILFDGNSLNKRDRRRALEALERFILEQFDGTYEWAVIAYSDHLQLMQPFTSEKTTVLSALARVGDLPIPVRQARATDATFTEHPVVVSRTDSIVEGRALDSGGPRQLTTSEFEVRERMLSGLRQFDHTIQAAVETMRAYAGLPGRKSLVLVTGALETLPGGSQLLGQGFPGVGGERATVDPMIAVLNTELQRRYQLIVQTANAAGFAIYPIAADAQNTLMRSKAPYLDVARETSLGFGGGGVLSGVPEVESETASRIMADGTGGDYFSTTRFYKAFDSIDDRTANSYVLGFRTDRAPDREYHKIRVETKNPKLRISHREGYVHISREARLLEELSTPLAFPKDRGDFEVAMEISEPEKVKNEKVKNEKVKKNKKNKKTAALTVAGVVPLSDVTLIPMGDEMVGRIFVYVAVYDTEGELVRLFRERQDVRLPAEKVAAADEDAPARFGLTISDMKRGEYTVTLTLRDEVTDRFGTGLAPVQL